MTPALAIRPTLLDARGLAQRREQVRRERTVLAELHDADVERIRIGLGHGLGRRPETANAAVIPRAESDGFTLARDGLQVRPLGPDDVFLAGRNRVVEVAARRRFELAAGLRVRERARAPDLCAIRTIRRLVDDFLNHAIDPHGVTRLD